MTDRPLLTSLETYIIAEDDEMLDFDLHNHGEIFLLHHSGSTTTFSRSGLEQLRNACMALLSNSFHRAVTETHLRLETERAARMSQSDGASVPHRVPSIKPELDML